LHVPVAALRRGREPAGLYREPREGAPAEGRDRRARRRRRGRGEEAEPRPALGAEARPRRPAAGTFPEPALDLLPHLPGSEVHGRVRDAAARLAARREVHLPAAPRPRAPAPDRPDARPRGAARSGRREELSGPAALPAECAAMAAPASRRPRAFP